MLQSSLAVSQRAWKRQFFRFPVLCSGVLSGGRLSSPLQCPICVRISAAALALCTCTQILTLTAVISISPVQINIFVRRAAFPVSAPLLAGPRRSISDVDGFLVVWVLFPPSSSDSEFSPHIHSDSLTTDITRPQLGVVYYF